MRRESRAYASVGRTLGQAGETGVHQAGADREDSLKQAASVCSGNSAQERVLQVVTETIAE